MMPTLMTKLTAKLAVVRSGLVSVQAAWVCMRHGVTTFTVTGRPALGGPQEYYTGMYYTCQESLIPSSKTTAANLVSMVQTNQHLDLTGMVGMINIIHGGLANREDDARVIHVDWTRRPESPTSTQDMIELLEKLGAWFVEEKGEAHAL